MTLPLSEVVTGFSPLNWKDILSYWKWDKGHLSIPDGSLLALEQPLQVKPLQIGVGPYLSCDWTCPSRYPRGGPCHLHV